MTGCWMLILSQRAYVQNLNAPVCLNQLGFYPSSPKTAVVKGESSATSFFVLSFDKRDTVFKGRLSDVIQSANSSLKTRLADFSNFQKPGRYVLGVESLGESYPFNIGQNVNHDAAAAALKGFYYQRVSMPLEEPYAGKWKRPAGHPDDSVLIHPSAASASRPAGTVIASPGGWYDAGDYNKYIVNSGITVGTLLSAYEDFPKYFDKLNTNIPESNDRIPDLVNEILYNLRWMLTMQDLGDGGVYNKCTNAGFDGMVMPGVTKLPRYVVQKGTAATLDFAAVMAQGARVFAGFKKQLPGLADSCLKASGMAWNWALMNPNLAYNQDSINKIFEPKITTGGYGDRRFDDEWFWAAAELFITTGDSKFASPLSSNWNSYLYVPSWNQVGTLGLYSLLRFEKKLPAYQLRLDSAKAALLKYADGWIGNEQKSAFKTIMGQTSKDFVWGSNAVAANQGILLVRAWFETKDRKYLDAALSNLDYILGRNATGYCFVTGLGTKSPMHPHHRQSSADGIVEPVPGLLAGGPNPGKQDGCKYEFSEPETTYVDLECSYASNEIAINWNAPFVYLANALEALQGNLR